MERRPSLPLGPSCLSGRMYRRKRVRQEEEGVSEWNESREERPPLKSKACRRRTDLPLFTCHPAFHVYLSPLPLSLSHQLFAAFAIAPLALSHSLLRANNSAATGALQAEGQANRRIAGLLIRALQEMGSVLRQRAIRTTRKRSVVIVLQHQMEQITVIIVIIFLSLSSHPPPPPPPSSFTRALFSQSHLLSHPC